jgi:hypothetical protein
LATVAAQKSPPFATGQVQGEKRRKSFAASQAYDISTRHVVAIHTQRRVEKIAGRRKKPRFGGGEAGPTQEIR